MWLILVFILILCYVIYYVTTSKYNYWKKKKVPHLQPVPLFGNYGDFILLRAFIGNVTRKICQQFPNEPYIGAYFGTEPTLLVQDPEFLKLILTKDFSYFNGREVSNYAEKEPCTKSMFFHSGEHWKLVRQSLTPLFSTAKIKNMFPLIEKCTKDLDNLLEYETKTTNVFEMNKLMSRYTIDSVGSCAFGMEINLMRKDYESNPYNSISEKVFSKSDFRGYANIARSIWPWFFYALGLQMFPDEAIDSMYGMITSVCNLRDNKPTSRNDFVDLLLSLKQQESIVDDSINNKTTEDDNQKRYLKMDNDMMTAMCLTFFGGGTETSATTLTMALFEIAKHEEVQTKVQQEIDDYLLKRNNNIGYDCTTELPYLSACFDETLRLYPIFAVVTREVMVDYTFPTGLKLDKGVRIHVPVYHIHRNPDNFPEPIKFRPERFLPENKQNIKPFTYLPFGEGPRICIGMRFGKMQVLAGLITVLKNYKVKLAKGMASTVDFDPRIITNHTLDGVYLEFQRREKVLS